MKKIVSSVMLTLILISTLTIAFSIQPVKATDGTIYIRADGSIDPPTAPIQRDGDAYTFTDNIYGSIVVERSNIMINGNGYTLQGGGSENGFYLSGMNNVTIKGTNIREFKRCVYLQSSKYTTIHGNNMVSIQGYLTWHIYLENSFNNLISENILTQVVARTGGGICLNYSSNNIVTRNNLTETYYGISIRFSVNNTITANYITKSTSGIWLYYSSKNNLTGNTAINGGEGIGLYYSSNNVLRCNNMSDNAWYNFGVCGYEFPELTQDIDASNTVNGKPIYYWVNRKDLVVPLDAGYVALVNCTNITVKNLELKSNYQGLLLGYTTNTIITQCNIISDVFGIQSLYSSCNRISENNITDNESGIYLLGDSGRSRALNNSVTRNNFVNNYYGIYVLYEFDMIYHNNFIYNKYQAKVSLEYVSAWDDGYPSGGNYWSDYTDVDLYSGPYQNETGSDGIWDHPYVIDTNNQDRYPLVNPWTPTPTYVQGIDASHWQGDINWSEVYGAGYRFAFVKASEGVGWEDSNFVTNMENGRNAGLLMGAYHFARPDLGNDAVDEALYFVSVARDYLKGGYLRPSLDLEVGSSLGKEALSNWVHEWMETVKNETGIEPIIYVNSNYANNYLDTSVTKYNLWIAHWTYDTNMTPNTGIWSSWDFWQYSNNGSVPGISGDVDLDVFNGNMQRLQSTFVIPPPPNQPPTCVIKLQKDGVEISEIDVGQFFDIYVGGSSDDAGIKQVRFSSDDAQDGVPTGEWTEWNDWGNSLGDWDASTKIKRWSFATAGYKEVWAEVKDDIGQTDRCYANIFIHPGYAIIIVGQGGWITRRAINYNANNAYRVLRNLGFDDEHIFYLNPDSPQDIDVDGINEVDYLTSLNNVSKAIYEVKERMGDNPVPLIIYLIGHGSRGKDDPELYFFELGNDETITPVDLNIWLSYFPEGTPTLIIIDSCYSGGFITSPKGNISASNRVIITSAHNDQKRWYESVTGLLFFSDDFWRNIYEGLNVKEAFIKTGDIKHSWLDDNGDAVGHPPNSLENDGSLAEIMRIGSPGVEHLMLEPSALAELYSPGELRVYDSQGRVTGLVNGEVKEEIPNSIYDDEKKAVVIFDAINTYHYEVFGTNIETYGLRIVSTETGATQTFTATDIPTTSGATHQYTIDWTALSRGEEGVTVQVDSDGDSIFEYTFTSDSELTHDEFIQQTTPTYTLTITATVGGTTDPTPGIYTYSANSSVQVTATPNVDYIFDHWELDSINVGSVNPYTVLMDNNHTLKAVFTYSPPPPSLTASISPLSASILVGQSVTFTSTVSGGYTPYTYQWYLNGNPVSGATSPSWTFTPTTSGIYYVYLKVTDAKANTAQSDTARITVATVPVGGYSIPINANTRAEPATPYIMLMAIITITFTLIKRKTTKNRR